MKILHLLYESKGDYFGIGGVGIRAYEIYKHLKGRHDITLLCKKYPGVRDGEIEGLRHIFVGTESKNLTKTLLSYAYQAARFVKRYGSNYDIIVEEFSPAIPTFLHALTKKPVVLQVQGYTGGLYFRKYNPFYALILYVFEHLRLMFYENFIFISGQTIKKLLPKSFSPSPSPPPVPGLAPRSGAGKGGGNTPLKPLLIEGRVPSLPLRERVRACPVLDTGVRGCIEVIPNGVSSELLSAIPEEGEYILYLGRIDIYGKGLDILMDAYKKFHDMVPDVRLVIAGDGRDRDKFNAMVMNLPEDVRRNVELLGWVSGDKKVEPMRRALFCVFPSRHEVQGIATLEAMACGKAVVVSDIPELMYAVACRAGVSFKTGDPASLACAMQDLMRSDERREIGLRGREWVRDLTWDGIASRYEDFLKRVVGK